MASRSRFSPDPRSLSQGIRRGWGRVRDVDARRQLAAARRQVAAANRRLDAARRQVAASHKLDGARRQVAVASRKLDSAGRGAARAVRRLDLPQRRQEVARQASAIAVDVAGRAAPALEARRRPLWARLLGRSPTRGQRIAETIVPLLPRRRRGRLESFMNTLALAVVGVAVVVVAAALIYSWQSRRSYVGRLRSRFGSEYDRLVSQLGGESAAERELQRRQRRVESFHIQPADPAQWAEFSRSWQRVQAEFLDDPEKSAADADRLVGDLLDVQGYPAAEFDQRVEDLSVTHAAVVDDYREARDLVMKADHGEQRTEDLRTAMVHYRSVFSELLGDAPGQSSQELDRTEGETIRR